MADDGSRTEALVDEVTSSTPLLFFREFLREKKLSAKQIKIGTTKSEVRVNLSDALLSGWIGEDEVRSWLDSVEGWGRQHLYLSRIPVRSLAHPQLINDAALARFLKKHDKKVASDTGDPAAHLLREYHVDDLFARLVWWSHTVEAERREELDEVRELDDGQYEFRAYRLRTRKSAARLLIRKTDGLILHLVDLPLGVDHAELLHTMDALTRLLLAPLVPVPVQMGPVLRALDQGALAAYGPKANGKFNLAVAPRQAKFRADGARVEFSSSKQGHRYADAPAVRHVRNAMQIAKFEGEAGKFQITFSDDRREHSMVFSLHAEDNRAYLFSRMDESEMVSLVDQLLRFKP